MKRTLIFISIIMLTGLLFSESARKHNPLHPGTDEVFSGLFNSALELKDSGKDEEFLLQMEEAYNRALSINADVPMAISLYFIGSEYLTLNRVAEAEIVLNKLETISMKNSDIEETDYWLDALHCEFYYKQGDYINALDKFQSVISGIETIYGTNNRFTMEFYLAYSVLFYFNGLYDKCIYYAEISLKCAENLYGRNHLSIAIICNMLGLAYKEKSDYDKAVLYFKQSLDTNIKLFGNNNPILAANYNNLAIVYYDQGDYDNAIAYYEKSLVFTYDLFGEKHQNIAIIYDNMADSFFGKGDYTNAVVYYEKSLAMRREVCGENHPDTAESYDNIGGTFCLMDNFDQAVLYYEKALEIRRRIFSETHPDIATSYSHLGGVAFKKGNYDMAIDYYQKALVIRLKIFGEKHPDVAEIYNNIGVIYKDIGRYNDALIQYEKALTIQLKIFQEKHPITAAYYNNIGTVYDDIGDYKRAIGYYEKALAIRIQVLGEKHKDTAAYYNNIGTVYDKKGDYDQAIIFYKKALGIRIDIFGEKHTDVATSYNNIGAAYCKKGDFEHSIQYFEKSLIICINIFGEKHRDTADSYNNIGGVYDARCDFDKAIEYYQKALIIYNEVLGDEHTSVATCYNNLGSAYYNKGDFKRAISCYDKSLSIRVKMLGEKHQDTAASYNNFGMVYYSKRDYDRAIGYFEKALNVLKEKESNQEIIVTSQNLGSAYIKTKKYKKAYTSFLTGIETIEKVRRLNLSGGTDFTSRNISSYYYATNACFLDKNMENMFNISERMRAMGYIERLSLKGAIDASGIDPAQGKKLLKLKDDIERLSSYRQKLISADTFNMNDQQKKEHDKQLDITSKQLAAAEDEFNKLDAEFMKNEKYKMLRDSSVVSVKTAQGMCGSDGAIIEYIIPEKSDDYMKPYAIIITGSSINAVELDSSYNYSGQIEKYRKAVKENNKTEIDKLGAEIYGKLIAPVESYINSAGIKKLIIVPDGSLAFLPFDSLKAKDNKYLSERYELNLTPSVTVSCMIKNRKYDKRDNLMAFGGGMYSSTGENKTRGQSSFRGIAIEEKEKEKLASKAYNSPLEYYTAQQIGWSDLPGTEREVSAINDKIYRKKNTEVYTGQKVSEENLKSLSKSGKLKNYSAIHLACHGYYDPEYPEYSAVVFSEVSGKLKDSKDDGYMSVEETALLNLQSEIVVLSACETGLGRIVSGDGVIGLTRAFQVAGSNRVLVTLWPVSDEATEAFMVSFYAKVRAGMSYSRALVEVKEEFRRSNKYSAPYYWAGFVLYE